MKLDEYLTKHMINKAAFARRCRISYRALQYYLEGRIPHRYNAAIIERETGGQVTAKEMGLVDTAYKV